jgi:peptidyl-prolyl cis-trans isomerase D
MLDFMRRQAQGWIVKALFAVIVLSFVFWGVGDYFSGGSEVVVADVGDQTITKRGLDQRVRQERNRLRQMFGGELPPDRFDPEQLRKAALNRMIRERLLDLEAARLGLTATNQAVKESIKGEPAFQQGGQFNPRQYQTLLNRMGMAASDFESRVRRDLAVRHLQRFVQAGTVVSDREIWSAFRQRQEKRGVRYIRLAPSAFADQVSPDEAALEAHYQENQEQYRRPAQTKVRYVVLSPEALAGQFEPDEEALTTYLENNAARYADEEGNTPALAAVREQVVADWRMDQATDRIYERLPTFKDLLYTRDNLDTVAEEFGLEVRTSGWIPAEGSLPTGVPSAKAFRESAFATQPGRNSRAVELDDGGFAGLHVVERRSSEVQDFSEVREQVRRDYRRARARELAREEAEEVRQALSQGADLAGQAQELGVKVETGPALTRERARQELPTGLGDALFANPADQAGVTRVARTDWAVFQVSEVKAPSRDELDQQQRQELASQIRQQRGQARFQAFIEKLKERHEVRIRKQPG